MRAIHMSRGFTLIELMVVLALLAIFAAIAVPGFSRFIADSRSKSAADELLGLLQYARGYAVENRTNASVCVTGGAVSVGTSCNAGGQVLRVFSAAQTVAVGADVAALQFRSNGSASPGSYSVCVSNDFARGFIIGIEPSGHIRLYPRGQKADGTSMTTCALP